MALRPQGRHSADSGKADLAPETAAVAPLLTARALRDFGDGFAAVLLPAYLLGIGLSPWQVGVISSAAPSAPRSSPLPSAFLARATIGADSSLQLRSLFVGS